MKATDTRPGALTARITAGTPPDGMTDAVHALMRSNAIPGLSMAVVDRDGVLIAGGFGLADRGMNRPATASTSYPWFSMTKVVSATAALRLADEGRLDLSAPAVEYVGCLRTRGSALPTVRQLLTHTAGLNNPLPIRWVHRPAEDAPDPETLLCELMSRRRAYRYPVGRSARYSNVGYLALGQIIAAVSGMPFTEYVTRAVLRPAGMAHTGFRHADDSDRATGYMRTPKVADPLLRRLLPGGIAGHRDGPYLTLNDFAVDGPAYGGLIGDVLDAGRFLRLHLREGELDGIRILSSAAARRMTAIDHAGKPFHHGIGWFRRPTDTTERWVEHFGTGAGFWNVMRLYPDRGIGVVVMTNSSTSYDFEPLFALLAGASWS